MPSQKNPGRDICYSEVEELLQTSSWQVSAEDPVRQELEDREELDGASELQCVPAAEL